MTPVTLRLKNFLSYGDAAGELDFESFDIAVLSGGNGQGKSALLDAITWALWGEARKSAAAGKPDEELLRAGARAMEVEFTFELEGDRFRVLRSFARSATGRTTRPGLDLHVMDPAAGAWRSLTATSIRETQAEIDRRVGIDYDTFINSAFLLQGRSDEFTRRRPAERKEVLGRILGLDRYERLAAAAGERHAEARNRVRSGEEAVERLRAALEDEPEWRRQHGESVAAADVLRAERDALLEEEGRLIARREGMEADARRAERLRTELCRIELRRTRLAEEDAGLVTKIGEAEAVVSRADEIMEAAGRFELRQAENAALESDAVKHRELLQLVHQAEVAISSIQADLEGRLQRAAEAVSADRERIAEDEARLAGRPAAEKALARAKRAAATVARLEEARHRRDAAVRRRDEVGRQLDRARAVLETRLGALEAQAAGAAEVPARLRALQSEALVLEARVAEIRGWESERLVSRENGVHRKAERDSLRREMESLRSRALETTLARERVMSASGTCPTCGTVLTDDHRREVAAGFDAELAELESTMARREREADQLHAECVKLADRFRELDALVASANGAAGHHAQVLAEIQRLEASQAGAVECIEEVEALRARLAGEDFEPELRRELDEADAEVRAVAFDEATLEQARAEAAQVERWSATLDDLAVVARRMDELETRVAERCSEIELLRADLAAGSSVAGERDRLAAFQEQLGGLAYDAVRHEIVRSELASLADAPQAAAMLATSKRNLAEWSGRREELKGEMADCEREDGEHRGALDVLARALAELPAVLERLDAASAGRRAADASLEAEQARAGGLAERLAKAALDRALLESTTAGLRASRHDALVSKHLRQAFGSHGIPSLIIEETLPELEARANEMLERLSGGRTRVTLETVRETRAGGTRETLEIRITDEQGATRPYETFSGGEAFRVDFALRLALSQLLADRAGVRIRTLVVDEGFGTQDAEGLQAVVESIRAVQADFDKILVITHLDELKDAFPVRIEVAKDPLDGSTFTVMGA